MTQYYLDEGGAAWHARRLTNIGGSEIASLFATQAGWGQSKLALHLVKSGKIPPPPLDDGPGSRIWYGKRLEPVIAKMAAELNGWTIEKGYYHTDDECPGMGCSLDYVITEPGEKERALKFSGPGILQLKNSDYIQHKDQWVGNEPPFHIILQLQHEIACSGYSWGVIGVLKGGNEILAYHYPASIKMAAAIRSRITEFWDDVRGGRLPNVDATDSTADALRALYPTIENEKPLDFTGDKDFMLACVEFRSTAANNSASEKAYKTAKANLESRLQGKTYAIGDGFSVKVSAPLDKPDRVAEPGEIIKGRKGGRTIHLREVTDHG